MIMAISETNKPTKEVMKPVKPKGPPLYTFFRPDKQSPTMAAAKQRKGRKKRKNKEKKFKEMEALYREWNSRINVISRKDIDMLYMHHVIHSIAIAEYFRINFPDMYRTMSSGTAGGDGPDAVRILDVGTGGGFPGIPLAIMFPYAKFTLCDSVGKKITVASEVAKSLSLANVETVNARAETIPGKFDYVVSRAVTSLDKFIPWVKGKYSRGIAYLKGGDVVEEIAVMTGRFRINPGSVHTWRIDSWANDPYFEGKLVIFIDA